MNERVLFENAAFLVVDKPPGAWVIPGRGEGDTPVVIEQLQDERKERLFVVHRLDRDTSGLLVFARTAAAHRTLSMAFEAGRVEKVYEAICVGAVPGPLDVQTALLPARRGRMRPARPAEGGKEARTLVRPLETYARGFSLVEAQPLTGRTHQIRVHLLSEGHPLAVDHQYGRAAHVTAAQLGGAAGDERPVLTRTPLHARRIRLPALEGGVGPLSLEAPLPPDMAEALALLRGS